MTTSDKIYFYNTLTRSKQLFEPLEPGKVKMYVCGPTVYSDPHIGNFRTFTVGDILRRWLDYRGYDVFHVINITDIDDKTILAVHISTSRTAFDAFYFLKMVLKTYDNKPLIMVDRGPWYRWALQRLGLDYRHETFGDRSPIEQWYSQFKARVKRFWKRFPYRRGIPNEAKTHLELHVLKNYYLHHHSPFQISNIPVITLHF